MELVTRNPQELHEITSLIAELMPPLPAGKQLVKQENVFLGPFLVTLTSVVDPIHSSIIFSLIDQTYF